MQGSPGLPGRNGVNGHNGLPGRDGRDDAKGEKGVAGTPGSRGEREEMGSSGADTDHRNWKQCAWKNSDNRDIGLKKLAQSTAPVNFGFLRYNGCAFTKDGIFLSIGILTGLKRSCK